MTLLDAYALVALVADEPAADEVETLLRAGDARAVVVNVAEAIDVLTRVRRVPADGVRDALEPLFITRVVAPVVSGEPEAWRAAELRARHYDRKSRALSLADCFLLAHALGAGDEIATADPALAAAARAEDLGVVALRDSTGRRSSS